MTEAEEPWQGYKTVVEITEVEGWCPITSAGDRWVLDYALYLDESKITPDRIFENRKCICPFMLANLYPYAWAMNNGATPVELGIAKSVDDPKYGYATCGSIAPPLAHGVVHVRLHSEPLKRGEGFLNRFYRECVRKTGNLAVPDWFVKKYATEAQTKAWARKYGENLRTVWLPEEERKMG